MRLELAVLACAALCASPLAAQDRWQFSAGNAADFASYVTPPDTFPELDDSVVGILEFGFDYSTLTDHLGNPVPEAPNTQPGDAATTGLLLGVNLNLGGYAARSDAAGVWTQNNYSGNYRVEVDVFYRQIGTAGSTENALIGINHQQTAKPINFNQNNANYTTIFGETFPNMAVKSGLDGYWLNYFGDIDLGFEDLWLHYGVPDTFDGETLIPGVSPHTRPRTPTGDRGVFGTGLDWGDGLYPDRNCRNAEEVLPADPEDPQAEPTPVEFFFDLLPYSRNEARGDLPGALTNVWTTFRFEYINGVLSIYAKQWPMPDQEGNPTEFTLLLSYDDPESRWTSGRVYLGMEDVFSGANELNRMIYDNLVITQLDEEPPPAPPTFELVGEVGISAFGITPTDIAFHDGDLFVSCFASNRQIVRISNALTTNPTTSTFAVTAAADSGGATTDPPPAGPITWAAGRGLTSIDVNPANGNILAAGDPGSGPLAVIEYDNAGNLIKVLEIATPEVAFNRINAARYFGNNGVLFGSIFGTLLHANSSLDALVDPFSVGGYPNFTRGIAFSGNDIFVRTTSNGPDKIQRFTGGTLGSLTDYAWDGVEFAEIGPQTFNTSSGIQGFVHDGTTSYVVANKAGAPIEIQFYNPSGPTGSTPVFVLDAVDLGLGQLLSLGFATTPQGQFMFVGRTDSPAATNSIQIWAIDGAELEIVPVGTLGDINGDGVINVADVTELANLVAAGTLPPLEIGDVNNDGAVNELDVEALANQIVN